MDHIAIDLGGRESQICIRREDGSVLSEARRSTHTLIQWLGKQPPSRVILETSTASFHVADAARAFGHQVRVVPSALVRQLGVGARRVKTDARDAQALSEVSTRIDVPSVHIPRFESRVHKTICTMRENLIHMRTQAINCVRGWLRSNGYRIRRGSTPTFSRRVHDHLQELQIGTPTYVERQLTMIDALCEQILAADKEVRDIAKRDPVCQRLMSTPGVGPVTAVRFVAAIDDVSRFPSAHQLESYLGLTPGEWASGQRRHRLSITKAGPPAVRWTLLQAAWSFRRIHKGSPIWLWQHEVEKRRGKHVAVVALARKLAGILYALWRDGTTYDPTRGAQAS